MEFMEFVEFVELQGGKVVKCQLTLNRHFSLALFLPGVGDNERLNFDDMRGLCQGRA